MRRSKLKPRKTTLIQRQKTHPAPTYHTCVNCGMNTDKYITDWDDIFFGQDQGRHPFEKVILRKYGQRHPSGIPVAVMYFCSRKCTLSFIEQHKLDILEEITS